MPSVRFPLPTKGLRLDINPSELPVDALAEAQNMVYRDATVKVRNGIEAFAQVSGDRVTALMQYDAGAVNDRIFAATTKSWFYYDQGAGAFVDIGDPANPLNGSATAHQLLRIYDMGGKQWVIGCNGVDAPKAWDSDPATQYRDMGGSPPVASAIATIADRVMLAEGLTIYLSDVVSAGGFDSGWNSVLVARLADTAGDIVTMQEYGNQAVAVFKEDAIYMVYNTGNSTWPVRVELVASGVQGPVSPRAVVQLKDRSIVYLARNGALMRFAGGPPVSMGEHLQKFFAANMDPTLSSRSFITFDPRQDEIFVWYPRIGATDVNGAAVVKLPEITLWPLYFPPISSVTGAFNGISAAQTVVGATPVTIGDLTGTIGEIQGTIGELSNKQWTFMLASDTGWTYTQAVHDDLGESISARLRTGLAALSDMNHVVLHEAIHIMTHATGETATVEIGTDDYGEGYATKSTKSLQLDATTRLRTQHRVSGKRFALRLLFNPTSKVEWGGSTLNFYRSGGR